MKVIRKNRQEADINHEVRGEQFESFDHPLSAMIEILSGPRIDSQEKRAPDTSLKTMEDPRFPIAHDLPACAARHDWCPLVTKAFV